LTLFSTKSSLPHSFEARMKSTLGNTWNAFLNAHHQPAPITIRINPAKYSKPDLPKVLWSDLGFYLNSRPVFTLDPLFHAGAYYVQEASSLFLEQALKQTVDLSKPLRVLDLCAAPGGKSTHLLSLLSLDSLLISNEVIRARAQVLWENIQKWGHSNAVVTNSDPSAFQHLTGYFDVIVIDAPCSGEGLFRKDPAACEQWSEENITLCSHRQQRILNDVWPALKENGLLIYSTCTYNEWENEKNLKAFADNHRVEFVTLNLQPHWGIESIQMNPVQGYRFYPHNLQGEGFFISAMIKKESAETIRMKSTGKFTTAQGKIVDRLKPWTLEPARFRWIQQEELIIQIPDLLFTEVEWISKHLYPLGKGTAVAELKHDKLIPEHAFALSNSIQTNNFHVTDLNEAEAIAYLRKDAQSLSAGLKGFGLIRNQKQNLGWVNHLGNRTNNLYPANWRIRMKADS
jgi:16S rRNA C967 or C1407 C5-methylase (RsmB/RsmF family)/NOL1/NOP2/fmu family ribosome biogenesis protein